MRYGFREKRKSESSTDSKRSSRSSIGKSKSADEESGGKDDVRGTRPGRSLSTSSSAATHPHSDELSSSSSGGKAGKLDDGIGGPRSSEVTAVIQRSRRRKGSNASEVASTDDERDEKEKAKEKRREKKKARAEKKAAAAAAAAATATDSRMPSEPGATTKVAVLGFTVTDYTAERAVLGIALGVGDPARATSYRQVLMPLVMAWYDGDWKLVYTDAMARPQPVTSADQYIGWAP